MPDLDFTKALVLSGGGTGGHFFPAQAIADGARARWPGRPIVFIGARRGIEARKLPAGTWPHLLLDVEGVVGRSPFLAVRSLWKLWGALRTLKAVFRRQPPWAVVGTGGYAAAPALLAARSLGIPYFLHESNAQPGALVRRLARGARRVWCGMPSLPLALEGANCLQVGTPVRGAFLRDFLPVAELEEPFRLLVLGGSGGARVLNEAVLQVAPALLERFPDWGILHQTGIPDGPRVASAPRHPRHSVEPFIDAVDQAMESSSLVLCRAGAVTCAELRAAGRPAVMVPLPTSAGNHQALNAQVLEADGRARVVPQGMGFEARLESALTGLMGNRDARLRWAKPEANRSLERCLDDLESSCPG
ncbi:MAG: UDP-N-acetylglucosamine--N-acetylmuramyl-(pentapeptide) pyrophosphoryl-undecaprenol N-acetylglucosamine transferase [Acidobacteria bacterium]|nr:UDP-N-acetylglucosamine--N-acetylmuramyl-(pentapeptide) pyrophosphoryl-undecaprenol N-acetylglucosamine transferase [Acidobacteriota bacterium]